MGRSVQSRKSIWFASRERKQHGLSAGEIKEETKLREGSAVSEQHQVCRGADLLAFEMTIEISDVITIASVLVTVGVSLGWIRGELHRHCEKIETVRAQLQTIQSKQGEIAERVLTNELSCKWHHENSGHD